MSDHTDRAAQVIVSVLRNAIEDFDVEEDVDASLVDAIAQALDTAGLLRSPGHDAAVAARAWGFTEERAWSDADGQRYFTVGYPASDPSLHTVRRLVGPWEPVEP